MGLILDGRVEEVPGLVIRSWRDDAALRLTAPGRRPRGTRWVRSILYHLTHGGDAEPREWNGGRCAAPSPAVRERRVGWVSCHAAIAPDGSVAWFADAVDEITYHSRPLDEVSIGIEIAQGEPGELWDRQLDAAIALTDYLTARLGIQRQFHDGAPVVPRLDGGGRDCVGIFQGPRVLLERLAHAGYEPWDFRVEGDRVAWRARQADLNDRRVARLVVDGIPGPSTARALRAAGSPSGMWIRRPCDGS